MKVFERETKILMFESDDEIREWIIELKKMIRGKISNQWFFYKGLSLHNGKPSIPDYHCGYSKNELIL